MQVNKGPDWRSSQWLAAAIGFFVSLGIAFVLVSQGTIERHWAVMLVALGLCLPPFIVGRRGG
jgi:hypothetical protein